MVTKRFTLSLLALFCIVKTQAADPVPMRSDLGDSKWQLVAELSDEFNADSIDPSKWNVDPEDFGVWSWEPSNVVQRRGSMHLRMVRQEHQRDGKTLFYTSGMARNPKTVTYGYFEARVKGCSRFPGASPAFWLYSIGPQNRYQADDGEVVAYSEIDVIELQQSEYDFESKDYFPVNRIDCNLHTTLIRNGKRQWVRPHSHPDVCQNFFDAPFDPRDDYHVYGVENSKDSIAWYIDGKEVARKPNLYWHLPMHLTLSLGLRYPFVAYRDGERHPVPAETTGDGFPTYMSVDYVRTWQRPDDKLPRQDVKLSATDWSKSKFIEMEKAKWDKNGWDWDQAKVEANFHEMDVNGDKVASGKERQQWYSNQSRKPKQAQ